MCYTSYRMGKKPASEIARLTSTVERGFASVAGDIAATNEKIGDLKTEMMEQFEHVDKQFDANHDRVRDIASRSRGHSPPDRTA